MAGDSIPSGQTFSTTVGLLYVFNLIVGTGALALPRAFQTAGYLLSVILLLVSAFTSYICATFVLESMAIANCVLRRSRRLAADGALFEVDEPPSSADGDMSEVPYFGTDAASQMTGPLPSNRFLPPVPQDFEIEKRVEVSEMVHLFLGKAGVLFAYFVLAIYLFGDLAVYSTTVPKSLMNVICSSLNSSLPVNYSAPCHSQESALLHSLSRFAVYRLCICVFLAFCLPMVLMGMARTKWLQLATTLSRWTAFTLMILLAGVQLLQNGPKGAPPAADFHGFGSLFGVAVYAFMCHHSIPGLVTPIRDKAQLSYKLASIYGIVYLFYVALSMSGAFAFAHVQDIYTINFLHDEQTGGVLNALLDYFLALFPVFVLTSSYVIVAITLCNNIRVLWTLVTGQDGGQQQPPQDRERLIPTNARAIEESEALLISSDSLQSSLPSIANRRSPSALFRQFGVALCVVVLPACISLFTDNVLLLASITGSFPGVGVQFVLPALLVLGARRALSSRVGLHPAALPAALRSPFAHWLWPLSILCWACFAVIVVGANVFRLG